jgi:ubiquinone/menaquinone biosynthesis C-methylase UbiE
MRQIAMERRNHLGGQAVMNENWRVWNINKTYGETLKKRADGSLSEMESSKAVCNLLKPYYTKGMTIADVGCGAGHYLRSLKKRIDQNIDYTGIDATPYYLELAKETFPGVSFVKGDIFNIPFPDYKFDIAICNNVLLHLPPPPIKPIYELIRIAKKYVIIRTVFGARNYIIQEIREPKEIEMRFEMHSLIKEDGTPESYNYFNMYSDEYIFSVINSIDKQLKVSIVEDRFYSEFDNTKIGSQSATKVENGKQISGNLILDWRFIVIEK